MAEESKAAAASPVTGFAKYDTETLLAVRRNMLGGMDKVGEHLEFDGDLISGMGTVLDRRKPGAANALEAGQTIVMVFDAINRELRQRGVLK